MSETTNRRLQQWGDLARVLFFGAGIVAAAALAWASRDSELAQLKVQLSDVRQDVAELSGEVSDMRLRYDDLVRQISADNTQIKADLATLLERTKNIGTQPQ